MSVLKVKNAVGQWESVPTIDPTPAVDAWLNENVDPATGYVLDSSLTMDNAAAPASAVGDLKSAIENLEAIPYSVKMAMDTLFSKAAYADDDAASSYATFHAWATANPVTSITAVFTQGEATIWNDDSLDVLKQYLVVTASYSDSTTESVTDYTLSGTLDSASSVITVSYGGHSTTFTVSVTLVGTTEYASALSDFVRTATRNAAGYDNGILWVKCTSSTDITNYACWLFDPKKTLWSSVNGKKVRVRFRCKSPDWSGEQSSTNQISHALTVYSGPNITSGSGKQKNWTLGNIAPTSNYEVYEYVKTLDLSAAWGSGTPTSASTFGVCIYSQSLHTVQYDSISVREVLN